MKQAAWARIGASLVLPLLAWGCGGGRPPAPVKDLQYTQAMNSARLAYDRGQMPQAVLLFDQALQRAEIRDDPADIGQAAYNLGVSLADDGQLDRAARVMALARRELARAGQRTTDVMLVQAKVAYRRGAAATAEAESLAGEVAASPDATPVEACQAAILLGEIALDRGDRGAALNRMLDASKALSAIADAKASPPASTQSALSGLEGRIHLAGGDVAKAAATFDRQAAQAGSAGMYGEMAGALVAAGDAYARSGDAAAAADRLYRGARSQIAQGHRAEGIESARKAANHAGQTELAAHIRALIDGGDPATSPDGGTQLTQPEQ